ncbi:MAG: ABC transporter permease [Bacteroidetes bacterium]|nr:MAG: ABC transporter permease [Bacteroidota bacterium]
MTNNSNSEPWDEIVVPKNSLLKLNLKEVWKYKDLLTLFVKRDIVAQYKQTVLGPLWYFIQPLLTTIMFTIVFGKIANISTDDLPHTIFYMAGVVNWAYFADCLNKTATTFKDNQQIFGKVYFPRLIVPLSIVTSHLLKYGIQFVLFLGFYIYFILIGANIHPNEMALLFPVLVLMLAGLGLGFGLIITSYTTKYRDLVFLLSFGVQLAMYATPVIIPLSKLEPKYQRLMELNPMTSIIETFRYGFLGQGTFSWGALAYTGIFTIVLVLAGIVIFNKTEKNFMDTV